MSLTWTSWLTNTIQSDVYFLINTLSQPNPIKQFYINDWIEEAFPISWNGIITLIECQSMVGKSKTLAILTFGPSIRYYAIR